MKISQEWFLAESCQYQSHCEKVAWCFGQRSFQLLTRDLDLVATGRLRQDKNGIKFFDAGGMNIYEGEFLYGMFPFPEENLEDISSLMQHLLSVQDHRNKNKHLD